MFESIEEFEGQVEEFQKNILASNELIKSVESLTDSIQRQQKSYNDNNEKIIKKIEDTNDNTQTAVETIKNENKKLINESIRELEKSNQDHIRVIISELENTKSDIKKYSDELADRYQNFHQKLESTNVSQLFEELQDFKKKVKLGFICSLTGIGISIVLLIT